MAVLSSKLWSVVLGCALALAAQHALATPVGGDVARRGDSVRLLAQVAPEASVTSDAATPSAPKSRWGKLIGGAAAGLGLAWLASTLGFGEAFAPLLLVGLVAVAVLALLGFLRGRRGAATGGLTYQAAGPGVAVGATTGSGGSQLDPLTPRGYSSKNVGNDASARPWEQYPPLPEQKPADRTPDGAPGWGVPDGFDSAAFLKTSKANFVSLQAAWDRADVPALRAMMTDGMIEQIKVQLAEREQIQGEAVNQTDVVMLEARLLGIEELGDAHLASVEFSGLIREDASAGPNPFREVWSITRTKSGPGGWLVAGVQALQ
jgi:predicted lipid-binding transport protein (Tim44 family)